MDQGYLDWRGSLRPRGWRFVLLHIESHNSSTRTTVSFTLLHISHTNTYVEFTARLCACCIRCQRMLPEPGGSQHENNRSYGMAHLREQKPWQEHLPTQKSPPR